MSVRNFYQTLYQNESLFQLPGEPWDVVASADTPAVVDSPPVLILDSTDLLTELDTLSAGSLTGADQAPTVDLVMNEQIIPVEIPQPEPVVLAAKPEPLPQPPSRPVMPSVLPPVQQQPRLPQLNHKVLLLADEELDPSNLLFLEKILKAVNLNINGVDLLNLHGVSDVDFPELLRGKYINHFITFGVPFERIQLDIMMDRYAPVRFEGITFLMADSLPTIEADQALKKRLWGALQRIFLQQ
ncbi:hypothetical protein [Spirosoma spitsbergense]|uniref:hypothetical protein n=1 Tax=Spirosoma spitsbergense TaxID=431554 RepID=UPI000373914E|nr:hypothetical protein [Spirosoma spitsbergense]